MPDIRILPEIISNKIAAGEVVERPCSVVKELLENAIDAKSKSITLEIEKGGTNLIRVSDNGCGMSKDNALLAIERYATSKIFTDQDLFSIKTFGFRGEALPSIASVSKFTLTTSQKDSDVGTRIYISGGKLMDVSDTGSPLGTMIEVKNLYFNTPARKKFLKSLNTEMGHIADIFSGIALGNPKIKFKLFHNNNLIKNFSSIDNMFDRVLEVLGKDIANNLCKVFFKQNNIQISGYISDPSLTRSTSQKIRLFVNNRMVTDKAIVSAIFRGYRGRIMKARFPLAILFLTLDFNKVDVNVHPAKLQVRFSNQQDVYSAVTSSVEKALINIEKKRFQPYGISIQKPRQKIDESLFEWNKEKNISQNISVCEDELKFDLPLKDTFSKNKTKFNAENHYEFNKNIKSSRKISKQNNPEKLKSLFPSSLSDFDTSNFSIIGQVFATYIILESNNNIILIDQHAAHERIIYEKLKKSSFSPCSQSLVVPETLELGLKEADIIENIIPELLSLGIEIEPFGNTTFIIKAIPAIIDNKEIKPLIYEMIEKIIELRINPKHAALKPEWLDKCLILMSCHSALRGNHILNHTQMEKLFYDLEKCENPNYCPHGRPTKIKWEKAEIEKLFKRIM